MRARFQVAVATLFAIPAFSQTLVEPERAGAIGRFFDAPPSTPSLRCEISPMNPSLNFAFQFQGVYRVQVAMSQFSGSGHSLTTYMRLTPEGRDAVYLAKTESLPDTGQPDAFAETLGGYIAGEGAYKAEVLVEDDLDRICRASWKFQTRRDGNERQLLPTTPNGAIEELVLDGRPSTGIRPGPRIAKLTILVHASPLVPTRSQLPPEDIQRTVDSISSILRELPAQSVRVIAYNLDQHSTIFRSEDYSAAGAKELVEAMTRVQLAVVDARLMRDRPDPLALLLGLVQGELQAPQPPDALIFLGPQTRMQLDIPVDAAGKRPASTPVFNLQFPGPRPVPALGTQDFGLARRGPPRSADDQVIVSLAPGVIDTIERLTSRIKGQTIPIRTPRDLADAIHRMDSRIPRTAPPATAPAPQPSSVPPSLPSAAEPPAAADPHGDEDPVELLIQVRDRVAALGTRIPNHTCVEAVQRDVFATPADHIKLSCDAVVGAVRRRPAGRQLKLESTDWLRLDVAYSSAGREIFSWAGAGRFEDVEVDELVPEGAMGTGAFTSMLLSAFQNRSTKYVFEGESNLEGRRLFEYSFAVAREQSGYKVRARREWIITGYTGSLLVDPKTGDLARLTVRTEELPPETSTCETTTSLDYGTVTLSGNPYLLPKVARQRFIGVDGGEAENTMTFSACRDFQAESRVEFDTGARTAAQKLPESATQFDLPGGLPVSVELLTAVHFPDAAAGDRIEGRLAAPVLDEVGKTLFPKGTAMQGRLMRVETRFAPSAARTVVLRWETIDAAGARLPIALLPKRAVSAQKPAGMTPNLGLRRRVTSFELPRPGETRYAVFELPGTAATLESGIRSEWLTAKP